MSLKRGAKSLLLLHARPGYQVQNRCRRTLDIAVHRPYLFQLRLRRCNLNKLSYSPQL